MPAVLTVQSEQPQLVECRPPRCRVETLTNGRPSSPDAWQRLFDETGDARIHHHPDYVPVVLPSPNVPAWTVSCETNGRPVTMGIFVPKRLTFGRPLLPGASSSLTGARLAGFGLLGSQDSTHVAEVVDTLAAEVRRRSVPVVEFEEIEEESTLWQELQRLKRRGFRFVAASDFDTHRSIRLPESADEFWGSFKSRFRTDLRRKRRNLGDYDVRRYRTEADVEALLNAAHEASVHTWQTHQLGLRIQADESEARYQRFLARHGAQRSYVLFRRRQPIAFVLGHQWRDRYYYDEVGFDRRLAEYSPGTVLLEELLNDLFAEDRPERLDFGLGDARYKRNFSNEQSRSATVRMFSPGFRGFWQTTSLKLRKAVVRSVRSVASRAGVAAKLRRVLRDRAASGRPS